MFRIYLNLNKQDAKYSAETESEPSSSQVLEKQAK